LFVVELFVRPALSAGRCLHSMLHFNFSFAASGSAADVGPGNDTVLGC